MRFVLPLFFLPVLFSVLSPARVGAEPTAPAQVTLPLPEYERLHRESERPAITVVDVMRLSGSFKDHSLALSLSGRASGQMPAQPVLTSPPGVRVYGCEGDALLTRGKDGFFELVPLKPLFTLRCRLATTGSDRLQLEATAAVLWVESQISDGEYVGSDDPSGKRSFTVVRVQGGPAEVVAPTAAARYRISLLPEETRFRYQLDVHNPNRSHQVFPLNLLSGEHVQQVDSQASYDIDTKKGAAASGEHGVGYRFDLPPGETSVVLTGTLKGGTFRPPLQASVQYLLMESHPLLRPQVGADAKRIAASETGIAAEYRGAQGFLLDRDETLSWTVTRLQALRTTSFAVSGVQHTFFLSADGKALGESRLSLDNQGAPDLSLPMRAEPTFASLQGDPTLLTKNEAGNLWLPLSQGKQEVLVQHRQAMQRLPGLTTATLWLPQLQAPATTAHIELRYPREWIPLYVEFASESIGPDVSLADALCILLLFFVTERMLALLGLLPARRRILAGAACTAAAVSSMILTGVLLGDGAVLLVWLVPHVRRMKWTAGRVIGLLLMAGTLFVVLLGLTFSRGSSKSGYDGEMASAPMLRKAVRMENNNNDQQQAPVGEKTGQALQGLPARYDLPMGHSQTHFYREMLATESPRAVRVLLLSQRTYGAAVALLSLILLALLLVSGRDLLRGWKLLMRGARERIQPPPLPPVP